MRVMLDTNILISAAMFPGRSMDQLIQIISSEHQLVLSSYAIDEFKSVVAEKFPKQVSAVDKFFSEIGYEYVYTPEQDETLTQVLHSDWECFSGTVPKPARKEKIKAKGIGGARIDLPAFSAVLFETKQGI